MLTVLQASQSSRFEVIERADVSRMLRNTWVRVTRLGSDELTEPESAKYTILLNSLAVMTAFLSLAFVAVLAPFLPESLPFFHMSVGLVLAASCVPAMNHFGYQRLARVFFTAHPVAAFTVLALLRGRQQNFQLYLLLPIVVAMFIYPPRDSWLRNLTIAGTLSVFIGLEIWLLGHEPLFPSHNPAMSSAGKFALDTGLVLFVSGFALHIYRAYMGAEDRAESLLRNILPRRTANALKLGQLVPAELFDEASIVFLDIAGFTTYSSSVMPEVLIGVLDESFSLLDDLAERHGLEKIKTIGDSYMAAAGIPEPCQDHAVAAAEFALEARDCLTALFAELNVELGLRIGINSGPVIAGVIGKRKFIYDLWGDTVNTASRMESCAIDGTIQVAPRTHALLGDRYAFEMRPPLEVRGKGIMETYLLDSRIEPDSQQPSSAMP